MEKTLAWAWTTIACTVIICVTTAGIKGCDNLTAVEKLKYSHGYSQVSIPSSTTQNYTTAWTRDPSKAVTPEEQQR